MSQDRQNMTDFTRASRLLSTDACRSAHRRSTHQGRAVDFEVWVDDLQLFLQCDSRDGVSLFDLTSGVSVAPAADADGTVRSQWTTHDAATRLAVRSHLLSAERAHFSQYKTARTLYDAVVARYSSPVTAALSRLMLPYLFPDLAAFATVADLITHLRTSDTRYRAALPAEFCAKNPPPMYITLYYLVTRLPDSLRSVRDHFLSLCPTTLSLRSVRDLRPSTAPQRLPLPSPPASSLPALADPPSDLARAASPTVTRLLATVVTDPSFESTAASALVAELVNFAAHCRLDYAASLVAESASCFAAALPHLVSMLLAPEGDPDAPDIPTPRSYAEAIEGPYSSQWQTAMDAEMASWKSTGTYVDEVPPPGANIVDGMWIFKVKRPPGSPPVFKRDYELHSLHFSTAFLQGSLHEEIWLRRPPCFTGSFPAGTQWSLRRPVYGLRQAPREWHDTLRTTLAALGFAPSTADPSLFLRTDTTLPPFYILVYIDDLVFATADTAGLAHVKSELQKRHMCTDLGELRSYLGLQITRDRARRTITLTQSHMVQQVLHVKV
ncbi:unnamed protein product [Closterium sp. NIES-53]